MIHVVLIEVFHPQSCLPVLSIPLLRGGDGDGRQLRLELDDLHHLAADVLLPQVGDLLDAGQVLLLPVEHLRGGDHDGEEGGEHGVLLQAPVEVLVPRGQGEPALVQLEHVSARVLVVLPHVPDEEAPHVVMVLKLLSNCLKRDPIYSEFMRLQAGGILVSMVGTLTQSDLNLS